MPIYAQLSDDIVVAVTQSSGPLVGPEFIELEAYDTSLCGQLHVGEGVFEPVPVSLPKHLSPLALRRRFTKAERTAIEWAAVDRADATTEQRQLAAALRSDLKDQEQASYIDLDDADVIAGVESLEAFGLIAEGRADEVLSAPVEPGERP